MTETELTIASVRERARTALASLERQQRELEAEVLRLADQHGPFSWQRQRAQSTLDSIMALIVECRAVCDGRNVRSRYTHRMSGWHVDGDHVFKVCECRHRTLGGAQHHGPCWFMVTADRRW